ncbi:MAG: glycosyltransferase family protein [Nanoarchaeota archaeon]
MKVVSVITGIGYGHAIRQAAILKELEKNGAEIVVASYGNALEYFNHVYSTLEIEGPKLPEKNSEFSMIKTIMINLKIPLSYLKNYFRLKRLFKVFNPEVIICDFEPLPLYMEKKRKHILVFNFDPLQYKEYIKENKKRYRLQGKYVSMIYNKARKISAPIIIPSFEKHQTKEYQFINPITRKLPKASQKELLEKLELKKPPIIIMFGGSHFSTELLYKIQDILPDIEGDFVVFTYKLSGKSHDNVTFLPFKENFLEYLKVSRGIITQAGHCTLSECIALKKPSLLFPIPNFMEQELNAYYAKNQKISMVENKKDFTKQELVSIIKSFIESIPELKENLEKIEMETDGAEQAATIINKSILTKQELDKQHKSLGL